MRRYDRGDSPRLRHLLGHLELFGVGGGGEGGGGGSRSCVGVGGGGGLGGGEA